MVDGVSKGFRKSLEISGVGYRAAKAGERTQLEPGLLASGQLRGAQGHHAHGRGHRPRFTSTASTSRPSAKSLPTFAGCASPSRIRARASATKANGFARSSARPGRQVRNNEQGRRASYAPCTAAQESDRHDGTAASLRAPFAASYLRRSRRRRQGPHAGRRVDARDVAARRARLRKPTSMPPKPWAARLPPRPKRPALPRSSSIAAATSITVVSARSPTRRVKRG